jgi:Skp family chaperone for outer membrane proteins
VKSGLNPTQFHIANAQRRFDRVGDLFAGVLKNLQRIEPALEKLSAMMKDPKPADQTRNKRHKV